MAAHLTKLGLARLFSLKAATLVIAAAMSLFGSVGQFVLVDQWDDLAEARETELRDIERRIATLRSTQTEYFNAQVQGNLLFALDPADQTKNRGLVSKLYQLSLIDRAFPFRAILAELAIAGTFDFTTTNTEYKRLQAAATADFSYQNFAAVTMFERQVIDQALEVQHKLQDRYFQARAEKSAAEHVSDRRRVWLIGLTSLGTCLLLVANLLVTKVHPLAVEYGG
jgi:hypothetical protein